MFNKKKTSKKKQIKKEKEQSDIVMFEDFDSNKNCEGDQKKHWDPRNCGIKLLRR